MQNKTDFLSIADYIHHGYQFFIDTTSMDIGSTEDIVYRLLVLAEDICRSVSGYVSA